MMDERSSRIFIGLCLLVLVWIGVYWMWQPSQDQPEPNITFEQPPPTQLITEQDPESQQRSPMIIDQTQLTQEQVPETELTSGPVLRPPEFFEHAVQPNETMQTIAEQHFGDKQRWGIIARANPFVDPQKLREGMLIRIPIDPDNIQGEVVGRETEPGVIESHASSSAGVIEYVVRPGDSLSKISLNIYGSARHAKLIYESNRDVLKSVDSISVGQLLKLPPLPDEDSESP
jgi:nucleoid-associated protein YgaU